LLLGKLELEGAIRGTFDFKARALLLQHIALQMKEESSLKVSKVLKIITDYLSERRLPFRPDTVLALLIGSGLLEVYGGLIMFRLTRFLEYFIAREFHDDRKFMLECISHRGMAYFARELDLYTSMSRRDKDILTMVATELDALVPDDRIMSDQLSSLAERGPILWMTQRQIKEVKEGGLSRQEVDDLVDEAEKEVEERNRRDRKIIDNRDNSINKPARTRKESLPMMLQLYGRIARNLEHIPAETKSVAGARFLYLMAYVSSEVIGKWENVIDEFIKDLSDDSDDPLKVEDKEKFRKHLYSVSRYMLPVIFSLTASSAICTPTLDFFFKEKALDRKELWIVRFLGWSCLIDNKMRAGLEVGDKLVGEVRRSRDRGWRYFLQLMAAKLHQLKMSRYIDKDDRVDFVNLAAGIEIALGGSKERRSRLVADLSQSLLFRELEDS
jgi:hypothetical protein